MFSQSSKMEFEPRPKSQHPKINVGWGLMAIAITVIAVCAAWLQPLYPFPMKPMAERNLVDQVLYPIESNGDLRLWHSTTTLNSIAASPDGKHLLAVGGSGAAIYSEDSGKHWTKLITGVDDALTYAWISNDGLEAGAITSTGLSYKMSVFGNAWTLDESIARYEFSKDVAQSQLPSLNFNNRSPENSNGMPAGTQITRHLPPSENLNNIRPTDVRQVKGAAYPLPPNCNQTWAVGDFGSISTSFDCSASWELQASAAPGSLFAVTFLADGKHGWAAGFNGALLRTTDGGDHWLPTDAGTQTILTSIMFLENGTGWLAGADGTLRTSKDFGRSWVKLDIRPQLPGLHFVYFHPDGLQGWVTGDNGTFLATIDGGHTWSSVPLPSSELLNLQSIRFSPDGINGSATGSEGMVVTTDGGKTWNVQYTPEGKIRVAGTAAYSSGTGSSWIARDEGQMLSTTDGWKTTHYSYSPAHSTRLAMWFSSDKEGWAVGLHPALTRTSDGGETWTIVPSPIQYARYPAPWFWASLLLIGGLWIRTFQTKRPPVEDGVAAIAASDAPTQSFSQDRLSFGPLAKGISRFLRNEATEPPLTLAISGDWGTGKSSLMKLICKDLESNGCRPVWFNAWHHQKDEQLLAALLSAVREQSPPSFFAGGWLFRWRLLLLRSRKHWFVTTVLLLVGVWVTGYLWAHEASQWQPLSTLINAVATAVQQGPTALNLDSPSLAPLAAKLAGLVTIFVALRKALTAYGADPAVLLSNSVEQFRLKEASALTSFRSRFAQEFDEVTQCLPGRLVVVIDDLDRCRAEAVLEVMEAVNFLVSSGKCFVIFGMATNRVQAALALSFEKIAQEMTELDIASQASFTPEAKAELERTRRRKYARDYLEKLVNLEIAVPDTPTDEPHRLLEESSPDSSQDKAGPFKRLKVAAATIGFVIAIAGTWYLGGHYQFPVIPTQAAQTDVQNKAKSSQPSEVGQSKSDVSTPNKASLDTAATINPYPMHEPVDTRNNIAFTLIAITLVVVAAGIAYALFRLRRSLYQVQDSPAFKAALVAWLPLVKRHRKTPRALKRFANRLRYLAMLQQAQRLDQNGWDTLPKRLKAWLGLSTAPEQPSDAEISIDEHRIVALGALYEVFGSDWKNCAQTNFPENELAQVAAISLKAYCVQSMGITWPPTKEELQSFEKSLSGIRIPS
ncbi:Ycf48-like protein [Pseudomonas fluorescens]|uniref:P-loop NTPase fold protein n=1 Tax=Pseudomonas fluorescens TaxID=294 RepID=UPI00123F7462|nr:P-loop NTPase fold protein [Pseudomonas fluorescens]VVP72805.1 Ycf48-like protein [Pseudomonas fluorescens]